MKKNLNIQINFTNKFVYAFITLSIFILIGAIVFAFGTSTPSTFGHSAGELDLSSGVSGNAIFNDNVGIGTSTPQVKLDVNGEVRIGNTGITCASNIEGSQRYNSVDKVMEYCDGTSWQSFGTGGSVTDLIISSDVFNYNFFFALGSPTEARDYSVQINSGVIVGSNDISIPAFTTGNLPAGSTVTIINNGRIQGRGGFGGIGATGYAERGGFGENGGNALELIVDTTINNLNQIWSGGGGGGAGGAGGDCYGHTPDGAGGGGGAGTIIGSGGLGGPDGGNNGEDGTATTGGAGGLIVPTCIQNLWLYFICRYFFIPILSQKLFWVFCIKPGIYLSYDLWNWSHCKTKEKMFKKCLYAGLKLRIILFLYVNKILKI